MGRTLPTIVQTLDAEREAWKSFRRALRKVDQTAYDTMWRHARRHAAPASMASRAVPLDWILMSMLTGIEREMMEVERLWENICSQFRPNFLHQIYTQYLKKLFNFQNIRWFGFLFIVF